MLLKQQTIVEKGKAGQEVKFTSNISVLKSGAFTITFPKEYIQSVKAAIAGYPKVTLKENRNSAALHCYTLEEGYGRLRHALQSSFECEEQTELVIKYRLDNQFSGFLSDDGILYPSSYGMKGLKGSQLVSQGNSYFKPETFELGFGATILKKTTYKGNLCAEYKYKNITDDEEVAELGKYGQLLASMRFINVLNKQLPEVPYNEKSAKFFYLTLMVIIKNSITLNNLMFGKHDTIEEVIDKCSDGVFPGNLNGIYIPD